MTKREIPMQLFPAAMLYVTVWQSARNRKRKESPMNATAVALQNEEIERPHDRGRLALNIKQGESVLIFTPNGEDHKSPSGSMRQCNSVRVTITETHRRHCRVVLEGCTACHKFLRASLIEDSQ